jgi:PQQ-dependent dehydrogenase (methanol/ethanol family)
MRPDGTWYSPLAEIDGGTVAHLDRSPDLFLGSPTGQAGAPAMAGDMLIVQTPFPHAVVAVAPFSGEPRQRWRYQPLADPAARGLVCCIAGRQPATDGERVFFVTLDGHAMALDPSSGTVLWDRALANNRTGEVLSGNPVVAGDRVLVGNAGDDNGARGWIAALDTADGHELWRRFTTGSDADVGIGPDFKPPLLRDRGRDLGIATWPPGDAEHGGGTVPGPILVDEDGRLLVHATGRPAPLNPMQRPGDNLWTSGLMARRLEDGSALWFVALNRGDRFGYGGAGPTMLVERDWQGARRALVLHANGNGLFWVIDRRTGEVLAADAYTDVTAHDGYDPATGAVRERPDKAPRENRVARGICPAAIPALQGGAAYSPDTGLAYLAVDRTCMDLEARRTGFIAGTPYLGANLRLTLPPEGPRGELVAWDVAGRRRAWSVPEDFPVAGGVLATAGGLVFYGTPDGVLKALDARTGKLLWSQRLPAGTVGQPVALRDPQGHEAIVLLSGLPGPFVVPGDHDEAPRDATAASGAAHALGDLPQRTGQGAALSVFRLR